MSSTKPNLVFPFSITPSHGAWCLAVAMVAHADLSQPQFETVLPLEQVFDQTEAISYKWLKEATGRLLDFNIIAYESTDFEESDFDSMCMFTSTGYRTKPRTVRAMFHVGALRQLEKLQLGIRQLQEQGKLTPANLTRKMRVLMPLTVFGMKSNRRRAEPVASLFKHDGRLVESPVR